MASADGGESGDGGSLAERRDAFLKAGEVPATPASKGSRERLDHELPPPGSASQGAGMWMQLEDLRKRLAAAEAEVEVARAARAAKEVEAREERGRREEAAAAVAQLAEERAAKAALLAELEAAQAGASKPRDSLSVARAASARAARLCAAGRHGAAPRDAHGASAHAHGALDAGDAQRGKSGAHVRGGCGVTARCATRRGGPPAPLGAQRAAPDARPARPTQPLPPPQRRRRLHERKPRAPTQQRRTAASPPLPLLPPPQRS
jgi:hypothetical protein